MTCTSPIHKCIPANPKDLISSVIFMLVFGQIDIRISALLRSSLLIFLQNKSFCSCLYCFKGQKSQPGYNGVLAVITEDSDETTFHFQYIPSDIFLSPNERCG